MKSANVFGWTLLLTSMWCGAAFAETTRPRECQEARSQTDINSCWHGVYQEADRELNEVYRAVLRRYADAPLFIDKLRRAQRLWIQLRDAELEAQFPMKDEDDPRTHYGSAFGMCHSQSMTDLTRQRTAWLRRWLEGEEGDICSGSIRVKE